MAAWSFLKLTPFQSHAAIAALAIGTWVFVVAPLWRACRSRFLSSSNLEKIQRAFFQALARFLSLKNPRGQNGRAGALYDSLLALLYGRAIATATATPIVNPANTCRIESKTIYVSRGMYRGCITRYAKIPHVNQLNAATRYAILAQRPYTRPRKNNV